MRKGKYRHYKGELYKVIGVSQHTETGKIMVLYKPLYGKDRNKIWARPYDMFIEWNNFNGKRQRRFERIPTLWDRFCDWIGWRYL